MKKKLIIASVMAALLLLVTRVLYLRFGKYKSERPLYVKSLGFRFSAEVDSLTTFWPGNNGYVYFHVTSGELDLSTEERANQKLKFNSSLRFILPVDGKTAFHSRDLEKYRLNDSLVVNSD